MRKAPTRTLRRCFAVGALTALLAAMHSAAAVPAEPPDGFDSEEQPKSTYKPLADTSKPVKLLAPELDDAIVVSALTDLKPPPALSENAGANNDQKGKIAKYLADCGVRTPAPWCAAFVSHHIRTAALKPETMAKLPRNFKLQWKMMANCNDIRAWGRRHPNMMLREPHKGCIFLVPRANGTFKHTGFVSRVLSNGKVETIEGNSNNNGSNEGTGVFQLQRTASKLVFVEAG